MDIFSYEGSTTLSWKNKKRISNIYQKLNIKTRKKVAYEADITQTKTLLNKIKPHQIFAASDFADPHGTHKICFDIIHQALKQLRDEGEEWLNDCPIWLYRGAWHEFEIHEIGDGRTVIADGG